MINVDRQLCSFQHSVDFWVLNALRTDCQDFRTLVHSLPGVFPTDALESVCRLSSRRLVSTGKAQYLVNSARRKSFHFPGRPVSNLPVPHPLDFDWRFDLQAVNHLSKICESISDARRAIKGNAISVNKEKILSDQVVISTDSLLNERFILIENGKKNKFLLGVSHP